MTIEPEDTEILTETPEIEIGQGEIQFTPTGIPHKDMSIAGMINDAPNACKALIRAGLWDKVCASPNPAGEAEMQLIGLSGIPGNKRKQVLIKVKNMLNGLGVSLPQAHHKCILENYVNRINLDKINNEVKKAVQEIQVVTQEAPAKEVPQDLKTALNGSVLTHPDGSTYTFGNRGRRPLWVLEWLKINPEPEA